jgi:hypothetical protein
VVHTHNSLRGDGGFGAKCDLPKSDGEISLSVLSSPSLLSHVSVVTFSLPPRLIARSKRCSSKSSLACVSMGFEESTHTLLLSSLFSLLFSSIVRKKIKGNGFDKGRNLSYMNLSEGMNSRNALYPTSAATFFLLGCFYLLFFFRLWFLGRSEQFYP